MGIAVRELLALDYFREFYLLAGSGGLNKEIQGVTFLEAPDGTRWSRGKELIMSSGYAIAQEPDCIERAFQEGNMIASAFMIKRERYLKKIPERMIELFDEHDIWSRDLGMIGFYLGKFIYLLDVVEYIIATIFFF